MMSKNLTSVLFKFQGGTVDCALIYFERNILLKNYATILLLNRFDEGSIVIFKENKFLNDNIGLSLMLSTCKIDFD